MAIDGSAVQDRHETLKHPYGLGRLRMFLLEYRAVGWWYWLATVCFLTAGVAGWPTGFNLAIGLTVIQLVHFAIRERSMTALPVQVRYLYLLLLLLALPEPLQWIYWIPTIGTWVRVLCGYCMMARTLSLLPWNCKETFSLGLLRRTFLSAPVRGSRLQG
jgi:hypothetical protein